MTLLDKNKKLISTILVALIIYIRCDFNVIEKYALVMNCVSCGIGMMYCLYLTIKDKHATKESIFNLAILWLVIFLAIEFVYGHFGLVYDTAEYSRQYTILTILPAVLCYEIFWHNKKDIVDILSIAGSLVIVATLITSMKYDYLWGYFIRGEFYRVGAVPGAQLIDTGNLYLIMLIPIFYSIIVEKKKCFIAPALIGLAAIGLGGSKSSALPIIFIIAIMLLGSTKDKKKRFRYILIVIALAVVLFAAIMIIPPLYENLGSRIVEMFTGVNDTEYDLHTSTGQRMAVIAAFKEHFWEAPLFGHGFYAFKSMPYSQLEEYVVDGERLYRHIQTHMNFLELLFSFGFFGFVAYYWMPVKMLIDTLKTKVNMAKLLCLSFLLSAFIIDLGLDVFYNYMTPYYVYLLVYCLLQTKQEEK